MPLTAPPRPARFYTDRHFFGLVNIAVGDRTKTLAAGLAARDAALDVATAQRWIAYLTEKAAQHIGDQAIRAELAIMNAALARLNAEHAQ